MGANVPNERIELRLLEYSPEKAEAMLSAAHHFAVTEIDRPAGLRNGVVMRFSHDLTVVAYWTHKRAVVVREMGGSK